MSAPPTAAAALFRSAPHRHVDTGHGEVAVRSVGEGPDVLLVHGWPVSGATFRHLLPLLAPHLRCHVVDLVGAGSSRFDRGSRIDVLTHATAVRRVVDELGLRSLAVVGHDSGGLVARHALAGDPRVRAWGLVDTEQTGRPHWRFRSFVATGRLPAVEHVLAALVSLPPLRRSRAVLGDAFADRSLLDGDFAELFLDPLRTDRERRWAAGRMLRDFDLGTLVDLPRLHARITVPVQLVWGAADPFFPVDRTRAMLPGFGGPAALHVVEGGKVFVHEEFPEEVAGALLPCLATGTLTGERAPSGAGDDVPREPRRQQGDHHEEHHPHEA